MEHEDNYAQNLMENNLQMASGGVGDVAADDFVTGSGGNIGGKFEQHEAQEDEEETKYIEEVQRSEKLKSDAEVVVAAAVGNGESFLPSQLQQQLQHEEYEIGDGDVNVVTSVDCGFALVAAEDEEELEIIKNDGDFSTTSNTTSTAGEVEEAEETAADVLKVEMKIEAATEQQVNIAPEEEEEPSSLATNGSSSLSEHAPLQPAQQQETADNYDMFMDIKENIDPLAAAFESSDAMAVDAIDDFELHSQLNPDAKEFVPSFGSQPTSPTSPIAAPVFERDVGEPAATHPSAVPRHLLGSNADDDDFVAQSPRKGRGFNMDAIALPAENEFEHEAAKRPHELEQEDDLIGDGAQQELPVEQQLQQLENDSNLLLSADAAEDCLDFQQRHSPVSSLLDHGPETCVDLDAELNEMLPEAEDDTMKQSIYVNENIDTASAPIEDLLNTVQPIPNDCESLNSSFTEHIAGDKELLNVEEKENISHSPSTEEMQMNLLNTVLHGSNKDIPQLPTDMDMQESFYMEQTSADAQQQLLFDNNPLVDNNASLIDASIESMRAAPIDENHDTEMSMPTLPQDLLLEQDFLPKSAFADEPTPDEPTPSSPISGEEKHLVEQTKEFETKDDAPIAVDELVCQMDDMLLGQNVDDGHLSQVEQESQMETIIAETQHENFHFTQEEYKDTTQFDALQFEEPQIEQQSAPLLEQIQQQNQQEVNPFDNDILQEVSQQEVEKPQPAYEAAEILQTDIAINPFNDSLANFEKLEQHFDDQHQQYVEISSTTVVEDIQTKQPDIEMPMIEEVAPISPVVVTAPEITTNETNEPALEIAAVAAVVASVGAAAVATAALKKPEAAPEPVKKASIAAKPNTTAKPKLSDSKKPSLDAKKPAAGRLATAPSAARPRTAPVKTTASTSSAEKKPLTSAAAAKPAGTATRKPMPSSARPATTTKTTTTTTTSRTTTAARPATASTTTGTAAKPATGGISSRLTAAKPRSATAGSVAATKPTTLGLGVAAKPKLGSPRSTLSSQLRKTAPVAATASKSPTAKSPTKAAPTTNGVASKSSNTSTLATSRKTVAGTSSANTTTTTTKTFTARPAPRTLLSSTTTTTTTTRRTTTVGSSPSAAATTLSTNSKTTSNVLRKSSPNKLTSALGHKASPIKSTTTSSALKSKTKEATKTAGQLTKPPPITKPKPVQEAPKTNGTATAVEHAQEQQLNGGEPHAQQENGTHDTERALQENGGGAGDDHDHDLLLQPTEVA